MYGNILDNMKRKEERGGKHIKLHVLWPGTPQHMPVFSVP